MARIQKHIIYIVSFIFIGLLIGCLIYKGKPKENMNLENKYNSTQNIKSTPYGFEENIEYVNNPLTLQTPDAIQYETDLDGFGTGPGIIGDRRYDVTY